MYKLAAALFVIALLTGCRPEASGPGAETPTRSVYTVVAEPVLPMRSRSFPSVLEPRQITPLAFEVGGRLGLVDLRIGQEVTAGELLLTIDSTDYQLQLEQAEAAVREADVALADALDEAGRQEALFARSVVSKAARDRAVAQAGQARARLDQAQRNLDLVRESRSDTDLRAPFDGVINSVEVQNYTNVQPGQPVITLYPDAGLETRILASYDVVSRLALGQETQVTLADDPTVSLPATITEIARRAPAVSSFPVIVSLEGTAPFLRPGMAVDVSFTMSIPQAEQGIELPLAALARHRMENLAPTDGGRSGRVFVHDPQSGTVVERNVTLGAVNGSKMLVVDGVAPGERVVAAGVPFLHPGQPVTLWEGE